MCEHMNSANTCTDFACKLYAANTCNEFCLRPAPGSTPGHERVKIRAHRREASLATGIHQKNLWRLRLLSNERKTKIKNGRLFDREDTPLDHRRVFQHTS